MAGKKKLTPEQEKEIKLLRANNEMYERTKEETRVRGNAQAVKRIEIAQEEIQNKMKSIMNGDITSLEIPKEDIKPIVIEHKPIIETDESIDNLNNAKFFENPNVSEEGDSVFDILEKHKMEEENKIARHKRKGTETNIEQESKIRYGEEIVNPSETTFNNVDTNAQYDVISLPSNGECYKNKIGRIPVSYLTAYDENIITSPNLYRDGLVIDYLLKNKIVNKGAVLTQMSKFWFDLTSDIVPNHMLSTDVNDMPEFFRNDEYKGKSMMCKKLTMLPIECIVRGYITGSGWASYKENGTVCGISLPAGLKESDKLPEPIYTPSTKAEIGDHDENISFERSIEVLEKEFPGHGLEYAEALRDKTIALYKKCADYALTKGIIIADTKFEFGLDEEGNVVLADEMLTPDSSRFWPLEGYEAGHGQPSFDKQFVRDWLKANPDSDYLLPQDVIDKTIAKYLEAYKLLTGKELAI